MKIPILSRLVDERFLSHRLKSTSWAGVIGGSFAISLFGYRYYVDGVLSRDLLAVGLTFVGVKLVLLAWYLLTD